MLSPPQTTGWPVLFAFCAKGWGFSAPLSAGTPSDSLKALAPTRRPVKVDFHRALLPGRVMAGASPHYSSGRDQSALHQLVKFDAPTLRTERGRWGTPHLYRRPVYATTASP
jgi:hypothetical protein